MFLFRYDMSPVGGLTRDQRSRLTRRRMKLGETGRSIKKIKMELEFVCSWMLTVYFLVFVLFSLSLYLFY